jgi:hypothetical protein
MTTDEFGNYEFAVSVTEPIGYFVLTEPHKQDGTMYGSGGDS